jgi:hypothetical protein
MFLRQIDGVSKRQFFDLRAPCFKTFQAAADRMPEERGA